MFRRFAGIITEGANGLFIQHPSTLATLLEVAWKSRIHDKNLPLGYPNHRSRITQLPEHLLNILSENQINRPDSDGILWDHLIYAYMIENTRIYEIFRVVLYEYLHGEKFGVPTAPAQHWLRNTEELFYRDSPPFTITSINSHVRPDNSAIRRNAYWRMFGMDLNHGANEQPYPYVKADAYNNEFITVFEEFLREAWVAITNFNNTSGTNPTDRSKIENMVQSLQNMLISRRSNGNLSREEFAAVSTMSWFHLTLSYDSPIILALRAEAASPEQRLYKVAQRIGLPAHGLSKNYFDIADPISRILIFIESGGFNSLPADGDPFAQIVKSDLNTIITHWSIITGRDMKARKVATA